MAGWTEITEHVATRCAAAGLDLVHPFRVDWLGAAAARLDRIPDFGRRSALGLVIGNTRALWPLFLAAVQREPDLRTDAHPLERYTASAVRTALSEVPRRWRVRWGHDPPPRRPAMQRLAHRAGLAHLAPCALNVHPIHGPWIALRAVVVVDTDGPAGAAPDPPNPCPDCARDCMPAFERAAAALRDNAAAALGLGETWRLWLAVRDACPIGGDYRYGDDQIAYHYCNDRSVL